jgi:hypothetical protein
VTAGWALRLAPLCFAVSALLRPDWAGEERALLARLDAEGGEQVAASLLGLAGCALAVPAVLGLMHMLRERRTVAGHVAGLVALVGVGGLAFHYSLELAIWQVAQEDHLRQQALTVVTELLDRPVIAAGFDYLPLAYGAGILAMGIVLRAANAVEPWTAYFTAAGTAVAAAGLFVPDPVMLKVGWGVALAGSNRIGRRVLAQDADDWAHWPSWTFKWTWKKR